MAHARKADRGANGDGLGGAQYVVPPADPLRIVQAAVAGDDLYDVTRQAAEACGRAVAILLPALGAAVHWPESGPHPTLLRRLLDYAGALVADRPAALPDGVIDAVGVTIGSDTVGVVAAIGPGPADVPVRPWLDAAAAAAAVATLMRDGGAVDITTARRAFLGSLELTAPGDVAGLLTQGRRLGVDLSHGAIGVCALVAGGTEPTSLPVGVLLAGVGTDRLLGLVPLSLDGAEALAAEIVAGLQSAGAIAATSTPRSSPEQLQEGLLEAAVLAELRLERGSAQLSPSLDETFTLLINVLLRSPEELGRLRARTVAELERYDALHDTELLATLQAFLGHHGSTTETAEAMSLHRHTVGYRLARVQEVAGLSPYESDGRERLSLGLKADRILAAERRRLERARPG
jgi:hypothetical protein